MKNIEYILCKIICQDNVRFCYTKKNSALLIREIGVGGKIFDGSVMVCYNQKNGGMSERLKEAVLKTVVPRGTVGSNPTPSARKFNPDLSGVHFTSGL